MKIVAVPCRRLATCLRQTSAAVASIYSLHHLQRHSKRVTWIWKHSLKEEASAVTVSSEHRERAPPGCCIPSSCSPADVPSKKPTPAPAARWAVRSPPYSNRMLVFARTSEWPLPWPTPALQSSGSAARSPGRPFITVPLPHGGPPQACSGRWSPGLCCAPPGHGTQLTCGCSAVSWVGHLGCSGWTACSHPVWGLCQLAHQELVFFLCSRTYLFLWSHQGTCYL